MHSRAGPSGIHVDAVVAGRFDRQEQTLGRFDDSYGLSPFGLAPAGQSDSFENRILEKLALLSGSTQSTSTIGTHEREKDKATNT